MTDEDAARRYPMIEPALSAPPAATDPRVLLLAPQDNCLVACQRLAACTILIIDGVPVRLSQDIELGHKLARRDIRADEKILRYGAPIGSASKNIRRGEHIHLHNLRSDYLPTHQIGQSHG